MPPVLGEKRSPIDAELLAGGFGQFLDAGFDALLLLGLRHRHVLAVRDHPRRDRRVKGSASSARCAQSHLLVVQQPVVVLPDLPFFVPFFAAIGPRRYSFVSSGGMGHFPRPMVRPYTPTSVGRFRKCRGEATSSLRCGSARRGREIWRRSANRRTAAIARARISSDGPLCSHPACQSGAARSAAQCHAMSATIAEISSTRTLAVAD